MKRMSIGGKATVAPNLDDLIPTLPVTRHTHTTRSASPEIITTGQLPSTAASSE